jgi:hypothetical protein
MRSICCSIALVVVLASGGHPSNAADEPPAVPAGTSLNDLPSPAWKTVDPAPFYPDGMERTYPDDLEGLTLEQFLLKFEQVTGIAFRLDHTALTEAGLDRAFQIRKRTAGLPASFVLDRVLSDIGGKELRWVENRGFKAITTAAKAATIQDVSTLEIGPLLDGGYSADVLRRLAMQHSSGPWRETDGEGGEIRVLGDRMTVRQTEEGIREVQVILTALASNEPIIDLFSTPADERVRDSLGKPVTGEFKDVPLAAVLDNLSKQAGIIVDFDEKTLAESGTGSDSQVSLNVRNRSLKEALEEVLTDVGGVELEAIIRDGVLVVTPRENADTIEHVRIYSVPEVAERGDTQALITLIQEMTSGPWQEIDGDGGTIESPRPCTLIIRQTERGLQEVEQLIVAHRGGKVRPKPAGQVIELKRYRLPTKMAHDLMTLIPRFVAPEEWNDFPDGSPPTIEFVSLDFEAILIIRQTQAVHAKIEKFITDLLATPAFQQPAQPQSAGGGFF